VSTTSEDIAAAKNGNLEPLLARLRAGVVTQAHFEDHYFDPGDWGGDETWIEVEDAAGQGNLTEDQYQQCIHAVVSITPDEYRARRQNQDAIPEGT
jgi:hypothetical protein